MMLIAFDLWRQYQLRAARQLLNVLQETLLIIRRSGHESEALVNVQVCLYALYMLPVLLI